MSFEEKAKLIAMARLCQVEGSAEDILNKFNTIYKEVLKEISAQSKPAMVEIFKRPF